MTIVGLIVGGLAVWRLSRIVVKENGPLMLLARLRARLATRQKRLGGLFDMVSCISCLSVWIAAVAVIPASQTVFEWFGYTLALSGVAVLIDALITSLSHSTIDRPLKF